MSATRNHPPPIDPAHRRLAALLHARPELLDAAREMFAALGPVALSLVDAAAAEAARHTRALARLDEVLSTD